MPRKLQKARLFANRIKFSGDNLILVNDDNKHSEYLKNLFYSNELCVSKEVTPDLYDSLLRVYSRLGINSSEVEAFVYASPDLNAECYLGDTSNCIIRFSSSLIDILDKNEFEFVVGHELGHFLLSHQQACVTEKNLEYYIQQRAQEISADRLGLIACDSLDIALKALLKTVSGLSNQHLRFDIGAFISQLQKVSSDNGQNKLSSHPSVLVRCRALLWFSLNTSYINKNDCYTEDELLKLDSKIQKDLNKYTDGKSLSEIAEAKNNLAMWMAAKKIIEDGKFTKKKQTKFSNEFGTDNLNKFVGFVEDIELQNVISNVSCKLELAENKLKILIPNNYKNELMLIRKRVGGILD